MDPRTEIKRLYFNATRTTIQRDVTRAIQLLKSMKDDDERQDVAVYMDGLSQMRSEWAAAQPASRPKTKTPGTSGSSVGARPSGRPKTSRRGKP